MIWIVIILLCVAVCAATLADPEWDILRRGR